MVLKKIGGREAKMTTQSSIKVTRRRSMTQTIAKTCTLMIRLINLCRYHSLLFVDSHYLYRVHKRQAEQGSCHAIIGVPMTQFACRYNKMEMNECVTTNITLRYASSNDLCTQHVHILYKTY